MEFWIRSNLNLNVQHFFKYKSILTINTFRYNTSKYDNRNEIKTEGNENER